MKLQEETKNPYWYNYPGRVLEDTNKQDFVLVTENTDVITAYNKMVNGFTRKSIEPAKAPKTYGHDQKCPCYNCAKLAELYFNT